MRNSNNGPGVVEVARTRVSGGVAEHLDGPGDVRLMFLLKAK